MTVPEMLSRAGDALAEARAASVRGGLGDEAADAVARLDEAAPRVSRTSAFLARLARARGAATRRARVGAEAARAAVVARAPAAPMNAGAANALATRLAREVTEARLAAIDRMADAVADHAVMIAEASLDEQGRALGVEGRERRLSDAEKAAVRAATARRLSAARAAVPSQRAALRARVARALRAEDPRAALAAVVKAPLDAARLAEAPAQQALVAARDAGTIAAGSRVGVRSYRFVATLDAATTPLCRSAHGRQMTAAEVARAERAPLDPRRPAPAGPLAPPLHWRCRSRLEPVR